jgi:ubiquinone/menaquinone biosynthesis C-methylase UbiE
MCLETVVLQNSESVKLKRVLYKRIYPLWKTKFAKKLKYRRLNQFDNILNNKLFDPTWLKDKKVLEIGCANGKDFIQFFNGFEGLEITGLDTDIYNFEQTNVSFVQADASNIPFDDKYFDLTVSLGVLEHIQPVEKLCDVIAEINRVSKSYIILVPSISTFFEPHTTDFLWQLRDHNKKRKYSNLNYFSDEAWLQFKGFEGACIKRIKYIPFLISNTIIYKIEQSPKNS